MTACARNLPQHFNGCTCTVDPSVTAEVDIDLTAAAPVPDPVTTFEPGWDTKRPGGLVKPVTCRKCQGGGDYTYASGAPGICATCNGSGEVEGSREAIAANKARRTAIRAFYDAASRHSDDAVRAFQHLREHDPVRWEKALASHGSGHPALMSSLDSYWEEQTRAAREERRRMFPPAEHAMAWSSYDDLPEYAKDAVRHQTNAVSAADQETYARARQWQLARVPVEIMAERIMAADPELVEDHGTFENYHAWYVSRGNVVDHGDSVWPSIEAPEGSGGYLDDGWHRFHSYVRRGFKVVPLLRSRDPAPEAPEQDPTEPHTTPA